MKILTFDIGATAIKHAVANERCELCAAAETPTNAKLGGKAVIDRICELISSHTAFDAVAISTAGQIDSVRGEVRHATDNIPNYTGTKIKEIIETKFGVPCFVENDVNCAAISEASYGAAKNYKSFLCLTYGTGIGGAVFIDGKILKGATFAAGEMGHMVTHAGGLPCTCGQEGCYEAYAATTALVKRVKKARRTHLTGRQIFEEQNFNNPVVRAEVDKWADEIAIGLASLIHVFNPECVVLGGGIMEEKYVINTVARLVKEKTMASYQGTLLCGAQLGNSAGMIGAAVIAVNNLKEVE